MSIADISAYLADRGWHRQEVNSRGATIWILDGDHEVLVPMRDDTSDSARRKREILTVLAAVERRPRDEISWDISSPLTDTQFYRIFPESLPDGHTTLDGGMRALASVRGLLEAAARVVVEGPSTMFCAAPPTEVRTALTRVLLGPSGSGSHMLTVRVPATDVAVGPDRAGIDAADTGTSVGASAGRLPLTRRVLVQLHDAVVAVHDAVADARTTAELAVFDETVTAGVSANMCRALARLAGPRGNEPFEIEFRWARGVPADVPTATVSFEAGSSAIIRAAAQHLVRLRPRGQATVTGVVDSLHGHSERDGSWRIKVRGEFVAAAGAAARRTISVRLADEQAYDAAITAHRDGRTVRAHGALSLLGERLELVTQPGEFQVLDR